MGLGSGRTVSLSWMIGRIFSCRRSGFYPVYRPVSDEPGCRRQDEHPHHSRPRCRGLRNAPLFTAVAVFSPALGIGANTANFTLIDRLILQLLPVRHPEEPAAGKFRVASRSPKRTASGSRRSPAPLRRFLACHPRYRVDQLAVGNIVEAVKGQPFAVAPA
jgi:hypothetical protein